MTTLLENVLFDPYFATDWHMTLAERSALLQILSHIRPEVSIEIGTFRGGSLRPIAMYSKRTYTFDVDPNQHRMAPLFRNVEFITGDTKETLAPVIQALINSEESLEFVLVDGSHEEDGVKNDLIECLKYIPKKKPLVIVMHDSCNPVVRRGIVASPWGECPYVHALDLDFVPGMLYNRADINNEMWGGLAVAVLLPQVREGNVAVTASFEYSRLALLTKSIYK